MNASIRVRVCSSEIKAKVSVPIPTIRKHANPSTVMLA
jgi:hypothetical protein